MTQPTGAKGFGQRLAQERRLKAAREARDIQRQDVAKAMRVANSTYGRWEEGTIPDADKIEELAAYFGVTPAFLHYGQLPREAAPLARVAEPPPPQYGGEDEETPMPTFNPMFRPATEEEARRITEEIQGRKPRRKANGGRGDAS